ncbi:FMN-binding protein [bacterium]|nr:FMN-binding protein [bacterium]MBU1990161.1 FMN-binding protein [bacterium]
MRLFLLSILVFAFSLNAKVLISPIDAMKNTFPNSTHIKKKNIVLNGKTAEIIQKNARQKLDTKIYKIFKAYDGEEVIGYGILISKKIRSKNGVVLYMISKDSVLKTIEVIAFNEPMEYLPSKMWNSQFQNIETSQILRLSKEIPTITGATLSAKSVTNGSQIAFAIYNEVLKEE